MRTSLTRLAAIEEFISGEVSSENKILFEANLILDKELVIDVRHQKQAYQIIRLFCRQTLRSELENIHENLFTEPKNKPFRDRILKIFQKN
jgi:hypothetical protein